jgi:hypothetical protein
MATYATAEQLQDYVADNKEAVVPGDDEGVERLLARAERVVDSVLGPWPYLSTGRKLDPASLDLAQREALARATCAAAEFELLVGPEWVAGGMEVMPAQLAVIRQPARVAPKVLQELAGFGLIRRSGTVVTPLLVVP